MEAIATAAAEGLSTDQSVSLVSCLFDPSDHILLRPVEVWTEGGRRQSRVIHKSIAYTPAAPYLFRRSLDRFLIVGERERANLFFGVCPRFAPGGYDEKWQIRTVRALWADVDDCLPFEVVARCNSAGLPTPTIIVASGNGTHLYWKLAEPYLIDDVPESLATARVEIEWLEPKETGGLKRRRKYYIDHSAASNERIYLDRPQNALRPSLKGLRIEDVITGVAASIGGDHTQDLSRLLRLPGTLNRKDQRNGRHPSSCEIVKIDPSRVYPFADFERFVDRSPSRKERVAISVVKLPPAKKRIGDRKQEKLNDLINACAVAPSGERSERDFDYCCCCIRYGLNADASWAQVSDVGKFAEKGEAYFHRTWTKAADNVREAIYRKAERRQAKRSFKGSQQGDSHHPANGRSVNGHPSNGHTTNNKSDEPLSKAPAPLPIEADDDPHRLARLFLEQQTGPLAYWRCDYYIYAGSHYRLLADEQFISSLSLSIKVEFDRLNVLDQESGAIDDDGAPLKCRQVTTSKVNNARLAINSMACIPSATEPPAWLTKEDVQPATGHAPASEPSSHCLSLTNGILDVDALLAGADMPSVLLPHAPQWFCLNALTYPFNITAECPLWSRVLEVNQEGDPERLAILQEWAGYMLLPDTSEQKFLILEGEGANGKSVYCAGLEAMLGLENVAHVPLELFGQRFALTTTLNKLANIVADCGEIDKIAEGFLKSFTSGDRMMFDRKGKPPVEAFPTARLMLATNNRPRFSDRSGGLWRRMILVPWRRQVTTEEKIKGMDKPEYWIRSGELPGIMNWAIAGLARLREQGGFTRSALVEEGVEEYRRETNPARSFLQEHVVEGDGKIPCSVLYGHYSDWCKANGYHKINENNFGREVRRIFKNVATKQYREAGQRHKRYEGIFYQEEIFDTD